MPRRKTISLKPNQASKQSRPQRSIFVMLNARLILYKFNQMNRQRINLHLMEADRELKKHLPFIKKITTPAINKISDVLPFKQPVDIVVYRYKTADKNFAISGYTPTGNMVHIYADPSHAGFEKLVRQQLPKTLAHELHHACRWQGPGFGETLKEVLITEGLASRFEQEVFGGLPADFYIKFSDKEIKRLWLKAKRELKSNKFSYQDWFFGNKKQNIPKHAGYALGYWIMGKITADKPSALVLKPAGQIAKNMI
jgi:uncharacterized protein YjaZ